MRLLLTLAAVSALHVWAQDQAAPSPELVEKMKAAAKSAVEEGQKPATAPKAPPKEVRVSIPAAAVLPIDRLPASTVIATVDGKKVTAGELQAVLKALPPQIQQQAQADRRKFVEQYGILRRLSDEARKEGLDQQSPYKESIDYGVMQVLYQAELNRKFAELPVSPEEVKKNYEANKDKYLQAKVRAIYLQFSNAPASQPDSKGKPLPTEDEAKAKAEDIVKQIREGADFVKMVKEYSNDAKSVEKDGDFGFIKKTDPIPADLKSVIFAAKPGDVAGPVRQANGFYIFRIEEAGTQPLEQVQGAIINEVKNVQFGAWITSLQKSLDVKMENELPPGLQVTAQPSGSTAQPAK